MQNYVVLKFVTEAHRYVETMVVQCVDMIISAVYGQVPSKHNNRVIKNIINMSALIAWSQAVTRAIRIILSCDLVDVQHASVYRVAYMAVAYAKANLQEYLPGAVLVAIHESRDTAFGSPVFETLLSTTKFAGTESSFYGEDINQDAVTSEAVASQPCSEDVTVFVSDAVNLAGHPEAEEWLGFKFEDTFMPSLIAAMRVFGVQRRTKAAEGGARELALCVTRASVAHCHPFLARAVLAVILRESIHFSNNDKSGADVLTSEHPFEVAGLQPDAKVWEDVPLRVIVCKDTDQKLTSALSAALGDPLRAGQAGDRKKRVLVEREDTMKLLQLARDFPDGCEIEAYRRYSASPSRLHQLLTSKLTAKRFAEAYPDFQENASELLGDALFDGLVAGAAFIRVSEICARASLGIKRWTRDSVETVIRDLGFQVGAYLFRYCEGFGATEKHLVLRVDSALMGALRKVAVSRSGSLSPPAKERIAHFAVSVMATVRIEVYPFSAESQAVLDLLVTKEVTSESVQSCLLRCDGVYKLRPALLHPVALKSAAKVLLKNMPPIELGLQYIAAECRAHFGAANISMKHVYGALQALRDITLPTMADGVMIRSASEPGMKLVHNRTYVSVQPACMPALYASFGGDVPVLLYSRQLVLDCSTDNLVSMVSFSTRDPLDWSRPFTYMTPSRTDMTPEGLLEQTRVCRHRHNRMCINSSMAQELEACQVDVALLKSASQRFDDVEPVLTRQRTTGANGSHIYVHVRNDHTMDGVTEEVLERLEELQSISVQTRIVGPTYKERASGLTPPATPTVRFQSKHTLKESFDKMATEEDVDGGMAGLGKYNGSVNMVENIFGAVSEDEDDEDEDEMIGLPDVKFTKAAKAGNASGDEQEVPSVSLLDAVTGNTQS